MSVLEALAYLEGYLLALAPGILSKQAWMIISDYIKTHPHYEAAHFSVWTSDSHE